MHQSPMPPDESLPNPDQNTTSGVWIKEVREFAPGEVLDNRYEIEKRIGRGGFGRTYLAYDRQMKGVFVQRGGKCIIKQVIEQVPVDPASRERFLKRLEHEVAVLADLRHPGHERIPDIYDYLKEHACLVLKHIDGQSLAQILLARSGERPSLPERKAVRYMRDVCQALVYMHQWRDQETGKQVPFIHRDVKPSNILRDRNGRIWLIDFGLAQPYLPSEQFGVRDSSGTEGFAPPEQLAGNAVPRSDVYALGATLHHLVTGHDWTSGNTDAAAQAGREAVKPGREVAQLVSRATATDPELRPDASKMLDDLNHILKRRSTRLRHNVCGTLAVFLMLLWLSGWFPHPNLVWDYVHAETGTARYALEFGKPMYGPIARSVETDEWFFEVQPEQHIQLSIWLSEQPQNASHILGALELVDPDEDPILATHCDPNREVFVVCTLSEQGEHAIQVAHEQLGGDYMLLVEPLDADAVPPSHEVDWSDALADRITSFRGDAGDRVTVLCQDGDTADMSEPETEVTLHNSAGVEIERTGDYFDLPAADTYTVSLNDQDAITDQCVLHSTDFMVRGMPNLLTIPDEKSGRLAAADAVDTYTFWGRAGQEIEITCRGIGSIDSTSRIDPVLHLYDQAGTLVDYNDDIEFYDEFADIGYYDAQITTRLPSTGMYTIEVEGYDGDRGAYRLTLK